jgi:hypothetical protein
LCITVKKSANGISTLFCFSGTHRASNATMEPTCNIPIGALSGKQGHFGGFVGIPHPTRKQYPKTQTLRRYLTFQLKHFSINLRTEFLNQLITTLNSSTRAAQHVKKISKDVFNKKTTYSAYQAYYEKTLQLFLR